MRYVRHFVVAVFAACLLPASVFAVDFTTTDRIIVKFRDDGSIARAAVMRAGMDAASTLPTTAETQGRERIVAKRTGLNAAHRARIAERTDVFALGDAFDTGTLDRRLEALRADPSVEWAVPDKRMRFQQVATPPNDPNYLSFPGTSPDSTVAVGQWYLRNDQPSGIRANLAWTNWTGTALPLVVAIVDTGVLFDHPDLKRVRSAGHLLPGFDFISDSRISNTGQARNPSAWDAGDWIDSTDLTNQPDLFKDCKQEPSSWHGSHVASIVASLTNNATGGSAINWGARVLPVRVLGKCFGYSSDIIAGMRWAAGLPVAGVPDNPNPARIINLSLGGAGACSVPYQSAVDEVRATGAMIFGAAGNESGAVTEPANCKGVVAVAGLRNEGDKVGYSAFGSEVAIAAPAGNCGIQNTSDPSCKFAIVGASDTGTTFPASRTYEGKVGTSFSTPVAAGVASLMRSAHACLLPDRVLSRMQASARPFPTVAGLPFCDPANPTSGRADNRCNCTTTTCGAGMLDAKGALDAAFAPQPFINVPATARAGTPFTVDAAGSTVANGRTIRTYSWTAKPNGTLSSSSGPQATIAAGAGDVTISVTITDSTGASSTLQVVETLSASTGPVLVSSTEPVPSLGGAAPPCVPASPDIDKSTAADDVVPGTPVPAAPAAASSGGGGGAVGLFGLTLLAFGFAGARRHRMLGR